MYLYNIMSYLQEEKNTYICIYMLYYIIYIKNM